ncbi:elongation factor Ts [Aminipila butyrica]|uniref:Elongation factor Ts n=1 Tax=Aminipila butyrica TaxID=433296 RepID=A0A858BTY7_9FIRM|nr:translation elongation factor Ts [Aminipila butyrica]QIB69027.1 elongation factor Ts [Aminipila butyrica]
MAVTAQMVKELREMTGAGMMDCKKVLVEADGDMDKAVDLLREKGLAKAAKKAGRVASEGLVKFAFSEDARRAAIIEVNSETDFVAKNDEFVDFVATLAGMALNAADESLEAFAALPYGDEGSVQEALGNKIAKIGENMNIRRFHKMEEDGCVYVGYSHGGGKIGVVIGLKTEASAEEVAVVGKDVAMQVASMNPQFVDETAISPEYLEHEKGILIQQALAEGKPADIVEKMVVGRLKKELKETCLVEQKFVKNSDLSVKEYVEQVAKEIGKAIQVVSMIRYEVGEGIEKKEEDFAAEVAAQLGN